MPAMPPVFAASAPAPDTFMNLRRVTAIAFPPSSSVGLQTCTMSLGGDAAPHKLDGHAGSLAPPVGGGARAVPGRQALHAPAPTCRRASSTTRRFREALEEQVYPIVRNPVLRVVAAGHQCVNGMQS